MTRAVLPSPSPDRLNPVDTSLFQLNGRIAIYRKPSSIYPPSWKWWDLFATGTLRQTAGV